MKTRYKIRCVTPTGIYDHRCNSYKELREYCGSKLTKGSWTGFEYYDYYGYNSKKQTSYYIKKEDPRYNNYIYEDETLVTTKVFTVGRFSREQILKVEGRKITINRAAAEKYGIVIEETKLEE